METPKSFCDVIHNFFADCIVQTKDYKTKSYQSTIYINSVFAQQIVDILLESNKKYYYSSY